MSVLVGGMGVGVRVLVGKGVLVRVGVSVMVLVTVGVLVGVSVGVKEETTNRVLVGAKVEEGLTAEVLTKRGLGVQVGGRTMGEGVLVGTSTVAGISTGGKGLTNEWGSLKTISTKAPKMQAPTISKTERISKKDSFMALIHPRIGLSFGIVPA